MHTKSAFDSIRTKAAEAVTQLMFAAIVVMVVGGTAAMCLERSVLFA